MSISYKADARKVIASKNTFKQHVNRYVLDIVLYLNYQLAAAVDCNTGAVECVRYTTQPLPDTKVCIVSASHHQ
jgi:hypothetical protein